MSTRFALLRAYYTSLVIGFLCHGLQATETTPGLVDDANEGLPSFEAFADEILNQSTPKWLHYGTSLGLGITSDSDSNHPNQVKSQGALAMIADLSMSHADYGSLSLATSVYNGYVFADASEASYITTNYAITYFLPFALSGDHFAMYTGFNFSGTAYLNGVNTLHYHGYGPHVTLRVELESLWILFHYWQTTSMKSTTATRFALTHYQSNDFKRFGYTFEISVPFQFGLRWHVRFATTSLFLMARSNSLAIKNTLRLKRLPGEKIPFTSQFLQMGLQKSY